MTADKFQRLVVILSNSTWTRHWLNYEYTRTNVKMAVQCIDWKGTPQPVGDANSHGLEELPGFVYVIDRTNEDGTPFVSHI